MIHKRTTKLIGQHNAAYLPKAKTLHCNTRIYYCNNNITIMLSLIAHPLHYLVNMITNRIVLLGYCFVPFLFAILFRLWFVIMDLILIILLSDDEYQWGISTTKFHVVQCTVWVYIDRVVTLIICLDTMSTEVTHQ